MANITGSGYYAVPQYTINYPQMQDPYGLFFNSQQAPTNYTDLATQQALYQALLQRGEQQGSNPGSQMIDIVGKVKDAYSLATEGVGGGGDGFSSLQDWWELNTTPIGSGSALSQSALNQSANLIASGNPLYASFGGGPGALAAGSAGGDAASLAAAEAAVGANSTTAGLAGASSMFMGAGIGGTVGPMAASSIYGDKEKDYSGASAVGGVMGGATGGAIAGTYFGPIGTIVGGLLGGIAGSLGLGGAAGGWGPGLSEPKVSTRLNSNFLSGWTDPYESYYDTTGMSETEKENLYGADFRTTLNSNLHGHEGRGYDLDYGWVDGYKYNSNYLGTVAKYEQNKILNDISFMKDKEMANKLFDALSKQNINFSTKMKVTENTYENSRAAKQNLVNSIQGAYEAAKKEVGYEEE